MGIENQRARTRGNLTRRPASTVPWQALGHGCKGLPPQPKMFAKEEPLDDHHHYRL